MASRIERDIQAGIDEIGKAISRLVSTASRPRRDVIDEALAASLGAGGYAPTLVGDLDALLQELEGAHDAVKSAVLGRPAADRADMLQRLARVRYYLETILPATTRDVLRELDRVDAAKAAPSRRRRSAAKPASASKARKAPAPKAGRRRP